MNDSHKRVGFFGGSFNPIHNGHIAIATAIRSLAHLDEVWFMVSPLNPFKVYDDSLLRDEQRMEMTTVALRGHEGLFASDYEFHLPRPSYTYDTLKSLSSDYPETDFVMIIGADNWLSWARWYRAEDILREHEIIVYPREGSPIDASSLPPRVTLVDTPLFNISSSQIRKLVAEGRSVASMVPRSILPLVQKYYSPKPTTSLSPTLPRREEVR